MSEPLPFSLGCLDWHVFHIPTPIRYYRTASGAIKSEKTDTGDLLDWVKENMQGKWTWGSPRGSNYTPFYIQDGKDAMLFKLRWSDSIRKPKFTVT